VHKLKSLVEEPKDVDAANRKRVNKLKKDLNSKCCKKRLASDDNEDKKKSPGALLLAINIGKTSDDLPSSCSVKNDEFDILKNHIIVLIEKDS
jgi:hypothetical protein